MALVCYWCTGPGAGVLRPPPRLPGNLGLSKNTGDPAGVTFGDYWTERSVNPCKHATMRAPTPPLAVVVIVWAVGKITLREKIC